MWQFFRRICVWIQDRKKTRPLTACLGDDDDDDENENEDRDQDKDQDDDDDDDDDADADDDDGDENAVWHKPCNASWCQYVTCNDPWIKPKLWQLLCKLVTPGEYLGQLSDRNLVFGGGANRIQN